MSSIKVGPNGTILEPARETPVYRRCDVLVVGGGPAGCAAAASAARAGADTVLMERYGHLGGMSTGGLVVWLDRLTDWEGQLLIRGFADVLLHLLPADAIFGPPEELWGSQDSEAVAYSEKANFDLTMKNVLISESASVGIAESSTYSPNPYSNRQAATRMNADEATKRTVPRTAS